MPLSYTFGRKSTKCRNVTSARCYIQIKSRKHYINLAVSDESVISELLRNLRDNHKLWMPIEVYI